VCCVDLGERFYRARELAATLGDSISTVGGGGSGGETGRGGGCQTTQEPTQGTTARERFRSVVWYFLFGSGES